MPDARVAGLRACAAARRHGAGLEVVASQAIYRSDAVVRRAAALQAHPLTLGARAVLHPADAGEAGVHAEACGKFAAAAGTATLPVAISDKVARGSVWIECGHGATAPLLPAACRRGAHDH